jgi:predicted NBD/HSP70 family sugar kinase
LANVINILEPDVIVLGGGVSKVARLYDQVPRLWPRPRADRFAHPVDQSPVFPVVRGDGQTSRRISVLSHFPPDIR